MTAERVLLTSSRAPVTLELVRVLARAGHEVFAADTFSPTLASHSRHLRRHFVTPSPRHATEAFGRALADIVTAHRIGWLIPTCEEVFHVGRHHERLSALTRLLCPPLEELARWHDKFAFQRHAASRGLLTPRTELVRDRDELHAALPRFPRYLLKPAFSRFASRIVTNAGPLAGRMALERCVPTGADPWLVQEYVEGEAECTYGVVHRGHVTAHCAYRTPHRVNAGAGCSFLAVDPAPTLAIARRLLEGMGYTGQFSLDLLRTPDGSRVLLECNPRATSGVHLMRPDRLVRGLLDPAAPTWAEPPGSYQQLLLVVLARNPLRLLANPPPHWCRDAVLDLRDPLPALTQVRQMGHFLAVSRRTSRTLVEATTEDIEWNGPGGAQVDTPREEILR